MRKVFGAVALACLIASSAASARGVSVHYIVVVVPGQRINWNAKPGDLTEIPMEVTSAPMVRAEGQINKGEVVAIHTIRALESVVLLEPIEGRNGSIAAGTVLTPVLIHHLQETKKVFCDLNIPPGKRSLYKWDCFNDSQGVGRLDDIWEGKSGDAFMGFWTDLSVINWKRKLAKSAAYRMAAPEERSTGEVGYRWCGGDGVDGPAKFSVTGHWSHDFFEGAEADACSFGTWSDPATKIATQIDRVTAAIHVGNAPKTLAYKIEGPIPPGPIAHFQPNGGIVALQDAQATVAQEVEEMDLPPLVSTASAPKLAAGPVSKGQEIYSIEVKHSITGILTNEVHTGKYSFLVGAAARPQAGLMPGQILYGAKVGGAISPQLVWCAPIKGAGDHWSKAICLPNNSVGTIYIEADPAMMGSANILIPETTPLYTAAPIVARQKVDLPTMTLSYVFAGWAKDRMQLQTKLDWGEGPRLVKSIYLPLKTDGTVHLEAVGGEVTIKPEEGAEPSVKVANFTAKAAEKDTVLP